MEESYDNSDNTGAAPVSDVSTMHSASNTQGDVELKKEGSRERHSRVALIVGLVVLLVAVVALIIGIVVVNLNSGNTESEEDGEAEGMSCARFEASEEIQNCIQGVFEEDGSVDGLIANYQEAIDVSVEEEDYDTLVDLINGRSNFLVSLNECGLSLRLLDESNLDFLDKNSLGTIYSNATGVAESCENEVEVNKWSMKYEELGLGGDNE